LLVFCIVSSIYVILSRFLNPHHKEQASRVGIDEIMQKEENGRAVYQPCFDCMRRKRNLQIIQRPQAAAYKKNEFGWS
jgi:hypothetical protein